MQPHEKRVVEEREFEADKLDRLRAFIHHSVQFESCTSRERRLMRRQEKIMDLFVEVLEDRIDQFQA